MMILLFSDASVEAWELADVRGSHDVTPPA